MGKLILNCGDHSSAPANVEVVGTMLMSPAEISDLGKNIVIPEDGERHVFSNNDHFLNGLRVAVIRQTLKPEDVVIHFRDPATPDVVQELTIRPSGCVDKWPAGFFDQYINDVQELGRFRRSRK